MSKRNILTFFSNFKAKPLAFRWAIATFVMATVLLVSTSAFAAITVTPSTWNVIGLDSNSPSFGPYRFPMGAKVCSDIALTNQLVKLNWEDLNTTYIDLRPGTSDEVYIDVPAGGCADAFFEVELNRIAAAFDQTRGYYITAGGASTPRPREIKIERLVSQSRNAITNMEIGTSLTSMTSVPNGGGMDLVVGNTYYIRMSGFTATQGYEQLESFVNFPNTIFQILSVNSTYSADTSPLVSSPHDSLYADNCGWDNDPTSPNYLSCSVDGKAGGLVTVTYQVKIMEVSSSRETLNSLIHDFSGSSFHYNADFSTSARFANIVNPNDLTISKSFAPTPIAASKSSTMTITISNPTYGAVGDIYLSDIFPTNPGTMVLAATPGIVSNCGGSLDDSSGGPLGDGIDDTGFSLTGGSVPALSSCIIKMSVSASVEGTYTNTTEQLWAGGANTTKTASDSLVIDNSAFPPPKPPSSCTTRTEMVRWSMDGATAPGPVYFSVHDDVSSATASYSGTGAEAIGTGDLGAGDGAWQVSNGWPTTNAHYTGAPYFEFAIDTSRFGDVQMHYDYNLSSNNDWGGQNSYYIDTSADGADFTTANTITAATVGSWQTDPTNNSGVTAVTTSDTTTYFRFKVAGAATSVGQSIKTPVVSLDNVYFDGCPVVPTDPPELTKAFSPTTVAAGDSATLTFTVTNPNATPALALSDIKFTDTLPTGLAVTSSTSSQCGGTLTLTAPDQISFTGGTLAAPVAPATTTTCTITATVDTTTAGSFDNTSGAVGAAESGYNLDPTGIATATLNVLAPPTISKQFAPNPVFTSAFGGVATLTFTLTNPNLSDPVSGVAFTDTFPAAPGIMSISSPLTTSNSCGGSLLDDSGGALAAGDTGIQLTGGTIPAGGSCTVTVDIEADTSGSYTNTSGNVSHTLNIFADSGNTATDSLLVEVATTAIALLKQVAPLNSGPWTSYLAVAAGGNVYYKFTVENLGDVPLSSVTVTDPAAWVDMASCSWTDGDGLALTPPFNLPVADADNGHIASCVTSTPAVAVTGSHPNTATATGSFSGVPYTDTSTATYATTSITLDKSADTTYFLAVGDTINYSYAITNSGAILSNPTISVTDTKISTVTCPSLSTIGNLDTEFDTGEVLTCTAAYTITASDVSAKQVTNIARANVGGVLTPNDTVTIPLGPDLSATKTNNLGGTVATGSPFSWNIVGINSASAGSSVTYNDGQVILTDDLPDTDISYSIPATATNSGGTSGTIDCTIDGFSTLTCSANGTVTIPPGESFSLAITTTTSADGIFANPRSGGSCTINSGAIFPEIDTTNNDCADTVTATTPDLTVLKTADRSLFLVAGETISYSYQVRNAGAPLTGPATIADDKSTDENCPPVSDAIVFTTGDLGNGDNILDPGEELTCTATYTTTAADVAAKEVTNIATATINAVTTLPVSLTIPLAPANVTLVKLAQNIGTTGYDIPGEIVRYTLTLLNSDSRDIDSDSIVLVDPIPANTTLVAVDPVVTVNPATSGLSLTYGGLAEATDHVEFSTDGSNYSYQPSNIGGVDPNVTHIRFKPSGVMSGGGTSFTVTFKVRIN